MKKSSGIRVPYAQTVYGKEEVRALMHVFKNPSKIVAGPAVKEFENKIAKLFGKKYGVMVNSGSSANLIALELLNLPRGSEVITPILTFSTTLAPILQKGLVPIFVDVEEGTYVVDVNKIERLITKKTKALMIPSLIGNLPNWVRLAAIAKKHKLWLIEDSCDTLGARFKNTPTGTYSHISTTSFYASHIITAAGGGGMVCVNDEKLRRRARVMAYWGRESTLFGAYEKSEELKKRFKGKLAGKPYDAKFIFSEIGYNFQPTEAQAAFGLVQLTRLKTFSARRKANVRELVAFFKKFEHLFILPRTHVGTETNWLAFPLTIKSAAKFSRLELTKYLEEHNIQTRPIFSGNILRQPAFQGIANKDVGQEAFPVTDYIMHNSFLIGCHHGITSRELAYIKRVITDFLTLHE